jgi:hypothetical protein
MVTPVGILSEAPGDNRSSGGAQKVVSLNNVVKM